METALKDSASATRYGVAGQDEDTTSLRYRVLSRQLWEQIGWCIASGMFARSTMAVLVTPALKAFVAGHLASGRYANVIKAVQAASHSLGLDPSGPREGPAGDKTDAR